MHVQHMHTTGDAVMARICGSSPQGMSRCTKTCIADFLHLSIWGGGFWRAFRHQKCRCVPQFTADLWVTQSVHMQSAHTCVALENFASGLRAFEAALLKSKLHHVLPMHAFLGGGGGVTGLEAPRRARNASGTPQPILCAAASCVHAGHRVHRCDATEPCGAVARTLPPCVPCQSSTPLARRMSRCPCAHRTMMSSSLSRISLSPRF